MIILFMIMTIIIIIIIIIIIMIMLIMMILIINIITIRGFHDFSKADLDPAAVTSARGKRRNVPQASPELLPNPRSPVCR